MSEEKIIPSASCVIAGQCLGFKVQELEQQRDELVDAVTRIKQRVCGEASPNWEHGPMTFASRGYLADLCDSALAKVKPT